MYHLEHISIARKILMIPITPVTQLTQNTSKKMSGVEVMLNRNVDKIKSLATLICEFDEEEEESSSEYGDD